MCNGVTSFVKLISRELELIRYFELLPLYDMYL